MPKNLIVLSDGTWQSLDSEGATNIARLHEELKRHSQADQTVFYQRGVGTGLHYDDSDSSSDDEDGFFEGAANAITKAFRGAARGVGDTWDRFAGGLTGRGIDDNIKAAYAFLAKNYEPGDKIFLLGFSRGAYTVRSLAGMIRNCGLLKASALTEERLTQAYEMYRSKQGVDARDAKAFRHPDTSNGLVDIDFLGVYDTVGALGLPAIGPTTRWIKTKRHGFHDSSLASHIRVARHALAIDEHRKDFAANLWTPHSSTDSQQRWFSGVHSDVGGGYEENKDAAHIAAEWLFGEARKAGLRLREDYRPAQHVNPLAPLHDSRYLGKVSGHPYRSKHKRPIAEHPDEVIDSSVKKRMLGDASYQPAQLSDPRLFRRIARENRSTWAGVKRQREEAAAASSHAGRNVRPKRAGHR